MIDMSDTRMTLHSIIKEGIEREAKRKVEEANVPLHVHLQALKALETRVDAHKKDMEFWGKALQLHNQQIHEYQEQIAAHRGEVERLRTLPHLKGDPGSPGRNANEYAITEAVLARMPKPKDGDPGKDADEERIAANVLKRMGPVRHGKNAEFDEEKLFTKFLTLLKKNRLLGATDIQGLQGWVRDGVKYRYEELMHGGGAKEFSVANGKITGAIPGSTFTLPFASQNWKVYLDGQRAVTPADYTIAGTSLTTTYPVTTSVVCDS